MKEKSIMKKIYYSIMMILVIVISFLVPCAFAEVKISVRNDQYVFPPSEFTGTEDYPDIITIENEYMIVELLPNRGITIWRIYSKLTGKENLYFNPTPLPYQDEITGKFYIEFGGCYPLYPWNKRDNQPCMTNYEIIEKAPEKVTIYTYGEEIETAIKIEQWITIIEKSTLVEIKVKISNPSTKTTNFKFEDRMVACPGGQLTENTYFELPADEVIIIRSENNWMGEPMERIKWPQSWSIWKNFIGSGVYLAELKKPFFALINRDSKDVLIKTWEPFEFFNDLTVRSWGPRFEELRFNIPVVYLQSKTKELVLPPGESIDFKVYIFTAKGLNSIDLANKYAAGCILMDKNNYTFGEEASVKFSIITSSFEENVKAQLNLLSTDGSLIKEISNLNLGNIEPGVVLDKEFKFKNEGFKAGRYLVQVKITSDKGDLLDMRRTIQVIEVTPISIIYYAIIIVIIIIISALLIIYKYRYKLKGYI